MAVSTQQTQVAVVRFPILEAATPCPAGLGAHLGRGIDVVDVDGSRVIKPALDTLAPQCRNQFKLLPPIARVLVDGPAIAVPVSTPTLCAAKSLLLAGARLAALLALAIAPPTRRQIAGLAAIFAGSVFKSIRVHRRDVAAVCTGDFHRGGTFLSHAQYIARWVRHLYFDIACQRIEEATRQPDMFVERSPDPVQEVML